MHRRNFLKNLSNSGMASLSGSLTLFNPSKEEKARQQQSSESLGPVGRIKKEIRISCPQLNLAPTTNMYYVGRGFRREETLSFMQSSDWKLTSYSRNSGDNGNTWSPWSPIPEHKQVSGNYTQSGGASQRGTGEYDPESGRLIKPVFQRIFQGDPQVALKVIWSGERLFWDHGFYQLSGDNGNSWGEAHQLKYEEGPDFDPDDWNKQGWLQRNEMYIGNSIVLKSGSVIISSTVPVAFDDKEDEKFPSIFPNNYRKGCVAGAVCFIGNWDKVKQNYNWKKSNSIFLPRRMSSRGLVELDISELKNGNLLLIMRGSNTKETPGRKWFSVSKDGGITWSEIKDMRYDTGERFYSPASIHKTIRSSKTGKLYWIGNISDTPPDGNYPRFPLYIVEVNEENPSFKKDTLTIIDTRDSGKDTDRVQLSNFALLENRETGNLEIYLTRLGENKITWSADACKYTIELF